MLLLGNNVETLDVSDACERSQWPRIVGPTPKACITRIGFLYTFWAGKTLADVNGDSCRKYAEGRTTPQQARRELEELRAAINHHRPKVFTTASCPSCCPTRANRACATWSARRQRE
jgi:hypothetical protein